MIILAGQSISGMAFALVLLHALRGQRDREALLTDKALKDLGSLLLTACSVWAYLAFVQWLIVWIGNVPETVTWYVARARHGWGALAWVIVIGQFLIPFQLLLFQSYKVRTRNLAGLGAFLLLMRAVPTPSTSTGG
jgi:hypothetical protein